MRLNYRQHSTSRSYLLCLYLHCKTPPIIPSGCIASAVTLSLNPAPVTKLASILPFVFNLIILLQTLKKQMNLLEQSYHQLVLLLHLQVHLHLTCKKWDLDFHQLKSEPLFEVVVYFVKLPTTIILPSACWAVAYTILLVNPEPALKVASRIHHY
jgi:hypothetical protein